MATSLSATDGPLSNIGGLTLDNGAEINAFDTASQKLFVVSGEPELQVVAAVGRCTNNRRRSHL